MLSRQHPLLRLIGKFTLVCFMTTSLTGEAAAANIGIAAGPAETASFFSPSIPETLGTVRSVYEAPGEGLTLFHIQDAHGQMDAQESTRRLLHYLKEHYGISAVLLEGTSGPLSAGSLRFFEDETKNLALARSLAGQAVIGGTELFLMEETTGSVPVFGIEEPALYRRNLEDFRAVLSRRETSDAFIRQAQRGILSRASQVMNKELFDFFKARSAYNLRSEDLSKQLPYLRESAEKHLSLDFQDPRTQLEWPQLYRFFRLSENSKAGAAQAASDYEKLLAWAEKHPTLAASPVTNGSGDFLAPLKNSEDPRLMLEKFYDAAAPLGFSFADYPALAQAWSLEIIQRELNAGILFEEIENLSGKVTNSLTRTPEEKTLLGLYADWKLLKDLLLLELHSETYEAAAAAGERLKPSALLAALAAAGAAVDAREAPDELFETALNFYRNARAREEAMLENAVKALGRTGQKKAAIITGGFHAAGLQELFRRRNISYADIMPHIAKIQENDSYEKLLLLENDFHVRSSQINHESLAAGLPAIAAQAGTADANVFAGKLLQALTVFAGNLDETAFFVQLEEWRESEAAQLHGYEFLTAGPAAALFTYTAPEGRQTVWTADQEAVTLTPSGTGVMAGAEAEGILEAALSELREEESEEIEDTEKTLPAERIDEAYSEHRVGSVRRLRDAEYRIEAINEELNHRAVFGLGERQLNYLAAQAGRTLDLNDAGAVTAFLREIIVLIHAGEYAGEVYPLNQYGAPLLYQNQRILFALPGGAEQPVAFPMEVSTTLTVTRFIPDRPFESFAEEKEFYRHRSRADRIHGWGHGGIENVMVPAFTGLTSLPFVYSAGWSHSGAPSDHESFRSMFMTSINLSAYMPYGITAPAEELTDEERKARGLLPAGAPEWHHLLVGSHIQANAGQDHAGYAVLRLDENDARSQALIDRMNAIEGVDIIPAADVPSPFGRNTEAYPGIWTLRVLVPAAIIESENKDEYETWIRGKWDEIQQAAEEAGRSELRGDGENAGFWARVSLPVLMAIGLTGGLPDGLTPHTAAQYGRTSSYSDAEYYLGLYNTPISDKDSAAAKAYKMRARQSGLDGLLKLAKEGRLRANEEQKVVNALGGIISESNRRIETYYYSGSAQAKLDTLAERRKAKADLGTDEEAQKAMEELVTLVTHKIEVESAAQAGLVDGMINLAKRGDEFLLKDTTKRLIRETVKVPGEQMAHYDKSITRFNPNLVLADPKGKWREKIKAALEKAADRHAAKLPALVERLKEYSAHYEKERQKEEKEILTKKAVYDTSTAAVKKLGEEIADLEKEMDLVQEKLTPKSRSDKKKGLLYRLAEAKKDLSKEANRTAFVALQKEVDEANEKLTLLGNQRRAKLSLKSDAEKMVADSRVAADADTPEKIAKTAKVAAAAAAKQEYDNLLGEIRIITDALKKKGRSELREAWPIKPDLTAEGTWDAGSGKAILTVSNQAGGLVFRIIASDAGDFASQLNLNLIDLRLLFILPIVVGTMPQAESGKTPEGTEKPELVHIGFEFEGDRIAIKPYDLRDIPAIAAELNKYFATIRSELRTETVEPEGEPEKLPTAFILHEVRNMLAPQKNFFQILTIVSGADAPQRLLGDIPQRVDEFINKTNALKKADEAAKQAQTRALLEDLVDVFPPENLEAIRARLIENEIEEDMIEIFTKTAARARSFALQMLGIEPPQKEGIRLGEILEELSISEPGLHPGLVVEDGESLEEVSTYFLTLFRTLKNIVINAGHATEADKIERSRHIAVRYSLIDPDKQPLLADYYVTIEIEDNGTGMPPEVLMKAFDPFFTTKGDRGTGIGLAMAKRDVEEYLGGKIEVNSIEGEGTVFRIHLPKAAPDGIDTRPSALEVAKQELPRPWVVNAGFAVEWELEQIRKLGFLSIEKAYLNAIKVSDYPIDRAKAAALRQEKIDTLERLTRAPKPIRSPLWKFFIKAIARDAASLADKKVRSFERVMRAEFEDLRGELQTAYENRLGIFETVIAEARSLERPRPVDHILIISQDRRFQNTLRRGFARTGRSDLKVSYFSSAGLAESYLKQHAKDVGLLVLDGDSTDNLETDVRKILEQVNAGIPVIAVSSEKTLPVSTLKNTLYIVKEELTPRVFREFFDQSFPKQAAGGRSELRAKKPENDLLKQFDEVIEEVQGALGREAEPYKTMILENLRDAKKFIPEEPARAQLLVKQSLGLFPESSFKTISRAKSNLKKLQGDLARKYPASDSGRSELRADDPEEWFFLRRQITYAFPSVILWNEQLRGKKLELWSFEAPKRSLNPDQPLDVKASRTIEAALDFLDRAAEQPGGESLKAAAGFIRSEVMIAGVEIYPGPFFETAEGADELPRALRTSARRGIFYLSMSLFKWLDPENENDLRFLAWHLLQGYVNLLFFRKHAGHYFYERDSAYEIFHKTETAGWNELLFPDGLDEIRRTSRDILEHEKDAFSGIYDGLLENENELTRRIEGEKAHIKSLRAEKKLGTVQYLVSQELRNLAHEAQRMAVYHYLQGNADKVDSWAKTSFELFDSIQNTVDTSGLNPLTVQEEILFASLNFGLIDRFRSEWKQYTEAAYVKEKFRPDQKTTQSFMAHTWEILAIPDIYEKLLNLLHVAGSDEKRSRIIDAILEVYTYAQEVGVPLEALEKTLRSELRLPEGETEGPLALFFEERGGGSFEAAVEVYEMAERTIVLPREVLEKFLNVVEPGNGYDAESLTSLEALKDTARGILGEEYGWMVNADEQAPPIQLILPVETTDDPKDLLVLITLITGPRDGIYLVLPEKEGDHAETFEASLYQAVEKLGIPERIARQITVVPAGPGDRDMSRVIQRIGSDPDLNGTKGIAAAEKRIGSIPYLKGLHRMSRAEQLREIVSAMIAAAYLREAAPDAPHDITSLERWMKEKGIDGAGLEARVLELANEFATRAYLSTQA